MIIGQAVGSGDIEKVQAISRALCRGSSSLSVYCRVLIMFALRLPILSLYDLEPDTLVMARQC